MIKVVCILFTIAIEDLKMCFSNINLPLEKRKICIEQLT